MKMTSSAMRTHTAELKIIKARINPEPYFFATNGRRLSGEPPRASVSAREILANERTAFAPCSLRITTR